MMEDAKKPSYKCCYTVQVSSKFKYEDKERWGASQRVSGPRGQHRYNWHQVFYGELQSYRWASSSSV